MSATTCSSTSGRTTSGSDPPIGRSSTSPRTVRTTATRIQPRLGFAYELNDKTVIRGGTGLFYSSSLTVDAFWPKYNTQIARIQVTNDGRAELRGRPAQRPAAADLRAGAEAVLRFAGAGGHLRGVGVERLQRRGPCLLNSLQEMPGPDRSHAHAAQLEQLDRRPASVRHHDGDAGRLRPDAGQPREGRAGQRQPGVQPGHRRQLPVHQRQPRPAALAERRRDLDDRLQQQFEPAVAADGLHEADEQPLAGARSPTRCRGSTTRKASR